MALHIQWHLAYSGISHTVASCIQWHLTYSGISHTVASHIQWHLTYSGISHTVASHIQWHLTYSGISHTVASCLHTYVHTSWAVYPSYKCSLPFIQTAGFPPSKPNMSFPSCPGTGGWGPLHYFISKINKLQGTKRAQIKTPNSIKIITNWCRNVNFTCTDSEPGYVLVLNCGGGFELLRQTSQP